MVEVLREKMHIAINRFGVNSIEALKASQELDSEVLKEQLRMMNKRKQRS